ncbi:MAG TPA: hypothetical protein VEN81_02665 [Planctomycetota bacterium]|nr:hypothetical protein [Planctomycetota bacterium]
MSWLFIALSWASPGPADALLAQSAAARRIAREIIEAFGRESVERAEPRIARLVEEYGEEAVRALRRAGPAGVEALEKFGATGVRIVGRWGEPGVRLLAVEGEAAGVWMGRLGDPAVEFMIRHPGAGRDLLERFGERALFPRLTTESVVTLNRLAGPIERSGRTAEILGVVERFGDRACDFLWRHKGPLFAGALLASFLADPRPYLDGVKELVVAPAAGIAAEAARRTNWTAIGCVAVVAALAGVWLALLGKRRPAAASGELA